MAMTREQVLEEMEADYEKMTEEERGETLFVHEGQNCSPTFLITEVRNSTQFGLEYVKSWSANRESQAGLEDLLAALLGGGMTCGDPDCPNCKGEVRPFGELTGTDDSGPTLH
jgi:hypothetical protein